MDVVDWRPELMNATIDVLSRAFAKNPIHRTVDVWISGDRQGRERRFLQEIRI